MSNIPVVFGSVTLHPRRSETVHQHFCWLWAAWAWGPGDMGRWGVDLSSLSVWAVQQGSSASPSMVPEALRTADVPRDPQVPVLREPVGLWGLPWAYSVTSESCRSRRGKATEGKALEGPADVFQPPAPPPPTTGSQAPWRAGCSSGGLESLPPAACTRRVWWTIKEVALWRRSLLAPL